jgi:hypothetical protein
MKKFLMAFSAILLTVVMLFAGASPALAATSGPNYPLNGTSAAGGGIAWTGAGNITADDTAYATAVFAAAGTSNSLQATGYGFAIPTWAIINGITVTIDRFAPETTATENISDTVVRLIIDGTISGNNNLVAGPWPIASGTPQGYGSTIDTWGITWDQETIAKINKGNFGVALSAIAATPGPAITASIDYIRVTITYTAATPTGNAPVVLGLAGNFAALAKSGITTTAGGGITGDIGVSPAAATTITGFGLIMDSSNTFSTSSLVTGKVYAANYAVPTPAYMTTAVSNMETAYTDAAGRAADVTGLGAGNISGLTLAPGVYKWSTGLLITTDVTLAGNATDVWIFQIAGNLTVGPAVEVKLTGGAVAKNIFWQVTGQTTLDTTVKFKGNILCATLISMTTNAALDGRALSQMNVTLSTSTIDASSAIPATTSAVVLASDNNPSTYGNSVTFTATVTTGATGTVQFWDGTTSLGSPVTLVASVATYTTSLLDAGPAGTHLITAAYSGDSTYAGSISNVVDQVVNKRALAVTATGINRVYDGTTAATVTLSDNRVGSDVLTTAYGSASFANKNIGTGKTVSVSGITVTGADAFNYTWNTTTTTTANITARPITVTAVAATKVYDGTTGSSGVPTITSGTIAAGDTAPVWTQTYDTKNVGTGKTLTPAGTVNDGNGGNNYDVTFTHVHTGVITTRYIVVSADAKTKIVMHLDPPLTYTIGIGSLAPGDSITGNLTRVPGELLGNYTILQGSLAISDGNGGHNYSLDYDVSSLTIVAATTVAPPPITTTTPGTTTTVPPTTTTTTPPTTTTTIPTSPTTPPTTTTTVPPTTTTPPTTTVVKPPPTTNPTPSQVYVYLPPTATTPATTTPATPEPVSYCWLWILLAILGGLLLLLLIIFLIRRRRKTIRE